MTAVSGVTGYAAVVLNDTSNVRWSEDELVYWVNEAIKQIAVLLPETNAVTVEIQLVEGTKQSVPSDAIRLIDVLRNTGVDGGVPSSPIRIVERDVLDTVRPNWHKDRASNIAKQFVFDERNPKTFYVYPPSRGQHIEIVYSQEPSILTKTSDLGAFSIFTGALINYVLFRAFAKDTEEGSEARSRGYEQSFYTAIGLYDKAESKSKPNNYAPPRNKQTGTTY